MVSSYQGSRHRGPEGHASPPFPRPTSSLRSLPNGCGKKLLGVSAAVSSIHHQQRVTPVAGLSFLWSVNKVTDFMHRFDRSFHTVGIEKVEATQSTERYTYRSPSSWGLAFSDGPVKERKAP